MDKEIITSQSGRMFDDILQMINLSKQKAEYQVNKTIIDLYWQIGSYVSERTIKDGWGKSTVKELSRYILDKKGRSTVAIMRDCSCQMVRRHPNLRIRK